MGHPDRGRHSRPVGAHRHLATEPRGPFRASRPERGPSARRQGASYYSEGHAATSLGMTHWSGATSHRRRPSVNLRDILSPAMSLLLRYDDTNMRSDAVGKTGLSPREWSRMLPRLRAAKKSVLKLARSGDQGFLDLPFDRTVVKEWERLSRRLAHDCTDLVVLGIGGADPRAEALPPAPCGERGAGRPRPRLPLSRF